MPHRCVAKGCRMGYLAQNDDPVPQGVSFHYLPWSKPNLFKKWVANLKKDNPDYVPGKYHAVCSLHFAPDDFKTVSSDKTGRPPPRKPGAKRGEKSKPEIVKKDGVWKVIVSSDRDLRQARLLPGAVPFEKMYEVAREVVKYARQPSKAAKQKAARSRKAAKSPTPNTPSKRPQRKRQPSRALKESKQEEELEEEDNDEEPAIRISSSASLAIGLEAEADEDESETTPKKENKADIAKLKGGEYLLDEINLPDAILNLADLEFRAEKHIPPNFAFKKEEDSVLIFLIQNHPKTGVPMMRGCIRIRLKVSTTPYAADSFKYSVSLDNEGLLSKASPLLDGIRGQGSLKKWSEVEKLIKAVEKYATGKSTGGIYLKSAECSLENYLDQCEGEDDQKRKIGFVSEQIRLVQCLPKQRKFNTQQLTAEFALWLHGIDKSIYQQVSEREILCLPGENCIKKFQSASTPRKKTKGSCAKIGRIPVDTPIGLFTPVTNDTSRSGGAIGLISSKSSKQPAKRLISPQRDRPKARATRDQPEETSDKRQDHTKSDTGESSIDEDSEAVTGKNEESMVLHEGEVGGEEVVEGNPPEADENASMAEKQQVVLSEERERDPDAAVPFRVGVQTLTAEEIGKFLEEPEEDWLTSMNIDLPKGGEMYLVDASALKNQPEADESGSTKPGEKRGRRTPYRKDGYHWYSAMSKRDLKSCPGVQKMMWYLRHEPSDELLAQGKKEIIDERFQRYEYTLNDEIVLVHYAGDERVAIPWSTGQGRKPYEKWNFSGNKTITRRSVNRMKLRGASSLDPKDNDKPMAELYSDLPPHAARPFRRGAQIINTDDALEVLMNPSGNTTTWGQLYYPKGGDVFLLDLSMYDLEESPKCYLEDGYKWLMYSKQKRSCYLGDFVKIYWCLKQPAPGNDERAFDIRFKRREIDMGTGFVLIHYAGDETIVDYEVMGEGSWSREKGFVKRGVKARDTILNEPFMSMSKMERARSMKKSSALRRSVRNSEYDDIVKEYDNIDEEYDNIDEEMSDGVYEERVIEIAPEDMDGEWFQDEQGNWYTTLPQEVEGEVVYMEQEEEENGDVIEEGVVEQGEIIIPQPARGGGVW